MNLSLFFTSDDFRIDGISYPAIPLFVDASTMRVDFLATEWMIYNAVIKGRSAAPGTWRNYAYNLLDWINYTSEKGWDWRAPEERFLAHYRNELGRRTPALKRNSIVKKMQITCWFYEWAHRHKYISTLPLSYEASLYSPNKFGLLAHLDKGALSVRPIVVPKKVKDEGFKRFYTQNEQERFMAKLSDRDKLIACWALFTGAREHEICALVVDQIPEQRFYRSTKYYKLRLEITKGSKPGDIYVPSWLLDATYQYLALFGRKAVVRAAQKRGKAIPPQIFLSRWGDALKPNSVYVTFTGVLDKLGINGTFHDLRHTYAITMLDRLMRSSEDPEAKSRNALLILKKLMRHASLDQTEIYLESRRVYLTDIFHDTWDLPEELWPYQKSM